MRLDDRARLALPASASALLLLAACGDDVRSDVDTDTMTTGMTSVSATQANTTVDPTDTDASTTAGSASDTSGTTTGDDVCETVQCGDACCEAGQECVLGECLDACGSGVRCGADLAVCCGADQVCLQPDCVTPGDACVDSFDCPIGEFCEPTIGACLPQQDPVACEVLPDFQEVEVALEWSHEDQQITALPLVADIDGDNLPEVIVSTFSHDDDGDGTEEPGEFLSGIVMVFAGEDGTLQFELTEDPPTTYGSWGYSSPGIADVDDNGLPDIVYAGRAVSNQSLIYAVNGTGNRLWTSHGNSGADYRLWIRNGAPSFANLDDDDGTEIIFGGAIIDDDGLVVWDGGLTDPTASPEGGGTGEGSLIGSNSNLAAGNERRGYGGISALADVTGDGYPEIITGRHAWSIDWVNPVIGNPQVTVTELWDAGAPDGWPAVGDIDGNGTPEVVVVGDSTVRVLDGATGELWCGVDDTGATCSGNDAARTQPIDIPDTADPVGRGGPPTIADFDGDGRPEVATAAAEVYTVFDFNRDSEDIVQPGGFSPPAAGDIFVKWFNATSDASSNGTGSSVFDFQGDGRAEVLYGDECYFRVYDGATGDTILEIENSSVTNREYPIVVDVDADGNSEILVVANDNSADDHCGDINGYGGGKRGLFVYGDPNDEWVRTRRVWNQHAYHVTNSDSRGNTPLTEDNNWEQPGLNNYRQNVQGAGVFNAPDLSVDLAVGLSTCLDEEFEIIATVRNEGSIGVPAGIEVNLYEGTDATGTLIAPDMTSAPLLPGSFEVFTWTVPAPGGEPKNYYVAIDGADSSTSVVTECDEGNNDAATLTVACPNQG